MSVPPPLPPRSSQARPPSYSESSSPPISPGLNRKDTIHLTPYVANQSSVSKDGKHPYSAASRSWEGEDPRSSSMQSLGPIKSSSDERRTLLLVYIHGFLGDETSFQSFPAHVHNLVTMSLSETHMVHSKVYPRYKSRKDISYARDEFSNWLYPHESATTDVVLLGHSLGGILAAEVALLHSHVPNSNELYQHRILGVVAFDTPFLGMHPSVIGTGIASLFRSAPETVEAVTPNENLSPVDSSSNSLLSPSGSVLSDPFSVPNDPNYNPSFMNDIKRPQRGKLQNAWYFWNKHCGELTKASRSWVTSHFEFGGCLADYPGLKRRYDAMRSLEDVDELSRPRDASGRLLRRRRFVNYYSASSGRIKAKGPIVSQAGRQTLETEMQDMTLQTTNSSTVGHTPAETPRLSLEQHADGEAIAKHDDMEHLDPTPMDEADRRSLLSVSSGDNPVECGEIWTDAPSTHDETLPTHNEEPPSYDDAPPTQDGVTSGDEELPRFPPLPDPPPPFDPSKYSAAKDMLKVAQKEHERQVKAYTRAKKDRDKNIRDREKLVAKRQKEAMKRLAKEEKLVKANVAAVEKEKVKRSATLNPEAWDQHLQASPARTDGSTDIPVPMKQKDRKFCMLPPKDARTGLRDSAWIRVYMEGMDEVAAHTSLFFVSDTYAKLVGDTAERIERWVQEDATKNALLAEAP